MCTYHAHTMQCGWATHVILASPCYLVTPPEQAHERLGDAAMQNDQPERAKEEYGDARLLLLGLRDAGRLDKSDRRPALLCRHRALLYTPTWSLPTRVTSYEIRLHSTF